MPRTSVPRPPGRPRGRRGAAVAAAVVSATTLLGACGPGNPSRTELTDALVTSGIPAEVARCAADAIDDALSADQLAQIVERGPGGAPRDTEATDDASDRVRAALATCREGLPTTTTVAPPSTAPTSTTVAGGGGVTVTTGDPATTGPAFDTVPEPGDGSSTTGGSSSTPSSTAG